MLDLESVCFLRFNDFGTDGGPAAKSLKPKFHVFSNHLSTHTGVKAPEVEVSNTFFFYWFTFSINTCNLF